ncbi:MAG: TonB-dependent receptor [Pirellulales bacterium]|nr:TonB-dependent receptor [Pirellulales bacterium]
MIFAYLFSMLGNVFAEDSPRSVAAPAQGGAASAPAAEKSSNLDALLDMVDKDPGQLSQVQVAEGSLSNNLTAPSSTLTPSDAESQDVSTVSELLQLFPSVTNRRVSGINVDSRIRGYNTAQLNASANGMTERKSIQDLDSLYSQIDPGIVKDMTVIEGPYSSLYGPGFAFLTGNLVSAPRYRDRPESHFDTYFTYGTNGQTLYNRENVLAGAENWGAYMSYGLRAGNDYRSGGENSFLVPSAYHKWDGLFAFSFDLSRATRIEFDYLRTDYNHVDLPGVVYDLGNSTNDQFNLRYIVQQDRNGPEQLILQTWFQNTAFHGSASGAQKQQSFYYSLVTLPYYDEYPVTTYSGGKSSSLGVRVLRTLGEADSPQWTVGADWRRYQQRYAEEDFTTAGGTIWSNNLFGVPHSEMDDIGILMNLTAPMSDRFTVSVGGRVDYATPSLDVNDPVITQIDDPNEWYYTPGYSQLSRVLGMAYATGKYALTDQYMMNIGTGFAMRMPDLGELYSDDPFVPTARFGNSYVSGLSTLKPERNWQFDLGLTYQEDRLSYGVRGFYATIWDYIMPVPGFVDWNAPNSIIPPHRLGRNFDDFPPDWRYDLGTPGENSDFCVAGYQTVNVDLAALFGGEVFTRIKVRDWLTIYGSMGYVNGTNYRPVVCNTSNTGELDFIPLGRAEGLPGIYPLHGKVAFRVFEPETERWSLELVSRLTASQDHVATSLSELPSRGFAAFDLHGYYQLRKKMRLTASIENIFNTYYYDPGSIFIIDPSGFAVPMPEPGIGVAVGLEGRF